MPKMKSGVKTQAAEIAAKMMRSSYAVFYHEHVLDKEPGKPGKLL